MIFRELVEFLLPKTELLVSSPKMKKYIYTYFFQKKAFTSKCFSGFLDCRLINYSSFTIKQKKPKKVFGHVKYCFDNLG